MKKVFVITSILIFTAFNNLFAQNCPFPAPAVLGNTNVCMYSANTYTVSNSTYYTSYLWKVKGGDIISGQGTKTAQIKWKDTIASINIITEDNSACKDSTLISMVVKKLPEIDPDKSIKTLCYTDTIHLSTPQCSGCTYEWRDLRYVPNPLLSSTYYFDLIGKKKAINSNRNATAVYRIIVTDPATGCINYDTVIVEIKATSEPKISGNNSFCGTGSTNYNLTFVHAPDSFKWSVENGTITFGENTQTISVNWNKTGKGRVNLTSYSKCEESVAIDVDIHEKPPVPVIEIPNAVCEGNVAKYFVSNQIAKNYKWTVTGGSIVGSSVSDTVFIRWNSGSPTYKISLIISSAVACSTSVSETITLLPRPVAGFTADTFETCLGNNIKFKNSSLNADSFYWSFGDGTSSRLREPVHTYANAGNYNVNLVAQWPGNCANNITKTVTIHPPAQAKNIKGKTDVKQLDTMLYSISITQGSTYKWNVINGSQYQYGGEIDTFIAVVWDQPGIGGIEVTETTSKSCEGPKNSLQINVQPALSLAEEIFQNFKFNAFPNPFNNEINLSFDLRKPAVIDINLTDVLGKFIFTQKNTYINTGKNALSLDLSSQNLKKGIYYLTIISPDGSICKKLVKL